MMRKRSACRVCHVTTVHSPDDTRIFIKECRTLAAAGYEVQLIVAGAEGKVVDGVQIRGGVEKAPRRLERMTKTVAAAYRLAAVLDADLYHLHDPELLPVGWLLRRLGKKVVYDSHEDLPRDLLNKQYLRPFGSLLSRPVEWAEDALCRRLSAVVAATGAIAERFRLVNARTLAVHNYPVVEERLQGGAIDWNERSRSVAYVGGISKIRGISEVVAAMGLLPEGMDASLELAGAFGDRALRDRLEKVPGWERVVERGILDREGVWRLLGRVSAGVVTFHPNAAQVVSQPIKMFEYMAAGIPVIASDFPLWRRWIEETGCGVLVNPGDPAEIAAAIRYLLSNPAEAQRMGLRGRLRVEREWNWSGEGERLVHLYDELLDVRNAEAG